MRIGILISLARSTGAAAFSMAASLTGSPIRIGMLNSRASRLMSLTQGSPNSKSGSVTATQATPHRYRSGYLIAPISVAA